MTPLRLRLLVPALLAAAVTGAAAQSPARAVAAAVQTAVHVDGDLADEAWTRAEPLDAFLQREPSEGAAPRYRTEARVTYDETAMYVAVRAYDDEPDRITGYLTRRDVDSNSDWIHVLIDSYHDRRTAYQFSVNPVGVKRDVYWFNDDNTDDSWDAVWDVSVGRTPDGWCAEFRIPYSQLRFRAGGDGRIGFSVMRTVARLNETSTWPLVARSVNGIVSQFGELAGVTAGRATKRLELVPYSVAQVVTQPGEPGNPLRETTDPGASVGLDLKYAVTPALSLTATVNPDFGQVEADPAVVNLSAFETFFSERRPFFIEGSGTYQFNCGDGCDPFYSRRIGRAPRGSATLQEGEYANQPGQSTILGAGKLTGRVGSFSVGVLAAATQEETARVAGLTGRRNEIVEPGTFYSVSRVRREFADQSSLGFMLTSANRRLVDSVSFLPTSAATAGIDYDWRIGKRFAVNGVFVGSTVHGTPEAITFLQRTNVHSYQRPDAEHVEVDPLADTLNGHSALVNFGKIAGERTRFNLNFAYKSPGLDLNDVGFLRRADEIQQSGWIQIRWEKPRKFVRDWRINFNQWSSGNFDGDRLGLGGNFNAHWAFVNNWSTGFGINGNARGFDDRLTRGGPGGYGNPNYSVWNYINTDDRKLVSGGVSWAYGGDGHGRGSEFSPSVTLRPTSSLSTELGLAYNVNNEAMQWVRAVERNDRTHYVFARLHQTTTSLTTRVNYTMTPTLSLQVYAQPFVSAGDYTEFKEMVDGRAIRFANRFAPFAFDDNPNFKVLSFRTTNVLRWEFKPGSTVFVVWQQGREGFNANGTFRFGRDYRDVFSTPSTNTLLVKLAYWLNP
jgi:hypothetical protein